MKLFNNFALVTALGMAAASTAGANSINFYASGGFISCSGCMIQSVTNQPFGDPYPNNQASYTTGSSTVDINYADLATASSLANVNSPTLVSYGILHVDDSGATGPVTIGAFAFALTIHDITDGGTMTFMGSSAGGMISHNSSNVTVTWSPTVGAIGPKFWSIFTPTPLVPPTTTNGETSIQGAVTDSIPEPASMVLMGAGLLGLGFLSRRLPGGKQ
jgi:hypothetical protein